MARVQNTYNPVGPSTDELTRLSTGTPVLISSQISGKVIVEVDDTDTDPLDEAMASLGFTPAPADNTSVAVDGAIIHWPVAQAWSEVLERINAVPAESGVIVMLDAGTYTMDVAADLDRVRFTALVASSSGFSGYPTTINMVAPFALLGDTLSLENIIAIADTTLWSGVGPFYLQLYGSSALTTFDGGSPSAIVLAGGGVLNAAVMDYSLFGGGAVETAEQADASIIHFLLTGASIIGDKASKLSGGAVAANVDYTADSTCVVAGVNGALGTAFGAGITVGNSLNGNAFFGPYNATTPADWNGSSPATIGEALDRIAAALGPIP